jgi:mono/diheme cytochrome c family protein
MAKKYAMIILLIVVTGLLVACTGNPNPYPTGATPIPTLIPATLPPSNVVFAAEAEPVEVSYPAGLPSASNGQALYDEHCAECHGLEGKGSDPAARDFRDADYRRGETPVDFYLAITEGHGGAGAGADMPAFGSLLTSDQRWDVVYYTWRFAAPDESLLAGQEIYHTNCEDCHGPTGRSMILGAADFSDQPFMSNRASSDLFVSVTQGKDSMPAWQARLDQDERWAVIDYVRTFTYDPVLAVAGGEEAAGEEVAFAPTTTEELQKPDCDAGFLSQSNPYAWDDADALASGEEVYGEFCNRCHGDDGTGVADLAYIPTDLTNPAVQALLRENGGEYLCRISEGLFEMPAFKRQMDQDQMWQVLTYVGTLGQ